MCFVDQFIITSCGSALYNPSNPSLKEKNCVSLNPVDENPINRCLTSMWNLYSEICQPVMLLRFFLEKEQDLLRFFLTI